MHELLEGARTIAVLDGRLGPLPLTGYDLLAIAGVATAMAVAALIVQRVVQRVAARGRALAPVWRSDLEPGEPRLAGLDLLEHRAAKDPRLARLLVAEVDADHAPANQLGGAAEEVGPRPGARLERPLAR